MAVIRVILEEDEFCKEGGFSVRSLASEVGNLFRLPRLTIGRLNEVGKHISISIIAFKGFQFAKMS